MDLTVSLISGFALAALATMLMGSRLYARKLEFALKDILRARYTHPEVLAAALSEAEVDFPELAPAGLTTATDSVGKLIVRHDHIRGYQPLPGTRMPPPPAPDQDDKTVESCRRRFRDLPIGEKS